VVQKLADGDSRAVADPARQPAFNAVVEGETALANELEDDRRDERLRRAGDREPVLRLGATLSLCIACGAVPDPLLGFHEGQATGVLL
jgi:hypothetical protein